MFFKKTTTICMEVHGQELNGMVTGIGQVLAK